MIIISVAISHAELAYHILDILMHSPGRDIFQAFSIGRHWKIFGTIVPIALLITRNITTYELIREMVAVNIRRYRKSIDIFAKQRADL
jgi:hypothetical protein